MPVPPKGNPARPPELAVNAARTMGGVSILFGLLAGCGFYSLANTAPGGSAGPIVILGVITVGVFSVPS